MFFVTFLGTLIFQTIAYLALLINGETIPINDVFSLIVLPSLLLNLLIAIPINTVMRDLASWMYPIKEEL
jgi:hypothetical protein